MMLLMCCSLKSQIQRQRANYEGARKGIGPNGHRSALRAF